MTLTAHVLEAALAGLTWRARQWGLKLPNAPTSHEKLAQHDELAQRAAQWALGDSNLKDDARGQSLRSIFDFIALDGEKAQGEHYLPIAPLALQKDVIFPTNKAADAKTWNNHWEAFCKAAEQHVVADESGLEALLAVFQRYAWCIPGGQAGVSLYDEARITAALAVCLQDNPDEALLVGGDISGVQDFIYTITDKGATSALRGRSFYLQLLTEAMTRLVLRELGLPITNIIYAGGGNFYLLARASDKHALERVRQCLSRILYQHHRGDLYVALEGLEVRREDREKWSQRWSDLARKLAMAKNRRFAELEPDELMAIFAPQGQGGSAEKQCQVCGREHPQTRPIQVDEDTVRKCPVCESYEELGKDLRNAQFISWHFKPPVETQPLTSHEIPQSYQAVLQAIGCVVRVTREFEKGQDFNLVWALSDTAFEDACGKQKALTRRLLVNVAPVLEADGEELAYLRQNGVKDLPHEHELPSIKPFQAMAYQSQGITRLGVFRADVDNLGQIFAKGFDKTASLARIASLSFAISLFFEGWVGEIAQRFNDERRKEKANGKIYGDALYAIYSGGDDLFFVGSWDKLVDFAWQVNEDLKQYSGAHPGIHISGGMVLVTEKYPLAKAAQDAEKAEKAAKGLTWWDEQGKSKKKNVFAFLGQPLPWNEFANARELQGRLMALDKGKRTAVIRKLLMNYALYAKAEEDRRKTGTDRKPDGKPQTLFGPWNWRILYLLKRNLDKSNPDHQKLTADFHVLPGEAKQPDYARLEWVGVAARWAELEDRKGD